MRDVVGIDRASPIAGTAGAQETTSSRTISGDGQRPANVRWAKCERWCGKGRSDGERALG